MSVQVFPVDETMQVELEGDDFRIVFMDANGDYTRHLSGNQVDELARALFRASVARNPPATVASPRVRRPSTPAPAPRIDTAPPPGSGEAARSVSRSSESVQPSTTSTSTGSSESVRRR